MKRKQLSALLLVCVYALCSLTAYAREEKTSPPQEKEVLAALGISLPEEGEDGRIDKGELAYLISAASNKSIAHIYRYLSFSDVKLDDWRHDAVIDVANTGIAVGNGDGSFGIDESVSADTAGVLLMRMLGYGRVTADGSIAAAYPTVYADILKGVARSEKITYADAYRAICNAMQLRYVGYALSGEDKLVMSEESFMEHAFNVVKKTGRVTGNEYGSFGIGTGALGAGSVEIDGVKYDTTDSDGARAYLGYSVDYYLDDDTVLKIVPRTSNTLKTVKGGEIKTIETVGNNFELKFSPDGSSKNKTVRFPKSCDFVYNGEPADFESGIIEALRDRQSGRVEILNTGDEYTVLVYAADTVVIAGVSVINQKLAGSLGETVSIDDNGGQRTVEITKDGAPINAGEIKKDDVAEVEQSKSGNIVKIRVVSEKLSGDLSAGVNEDGEIGIDGITYACSNYFINNVKGKETLTLGKRYTFLFNSGGEITALASDKDFEEKGEFLFVVDSRYSDVEDYGYIKAVALDGALVRREFAEYVRLNGGTKSEAAVVAGMLVPKINEKKQCSLMYIETNSEGKVYKIYTPDGKYVDGTPSGQKFIERGAAAANRKYKALTKCFLINTNDSNFPEFYINADTKILQLPASDASDSDFDDEENYQQRSSSVFSDAKDYIVEAYNFDEYNVADIVLLRKSKSFDTQKDNSSLIVVRSVTKLVDADGDVVPAIAGYSNGEWVTVPIYDDEALFYTKNGKRTEIAKGDIIKIGYDLSNKAIFTQYFKNVFNDIELTPNPEGRNDGNAIIIGTVVASDDEFLRVRMGSGGSMSERVLRGEGTVSIVDSDIPAAEKGDRGDLTPGTKVLVRVFYSKAVDILIIK